MLPWETDEGRGGRGPQSERPSSSGRFSLSWEENSGVGELRGEWPQHCSVCVLGAELPYSQWQQSLCRNRKRRLQTLLASELIVKGSTRMAGLRSPTGTVHWNACRGTAGAGCTEMINGIWGGLGESMTLSTTHTHQGPPPAKRKLRPAGTWATFAVLQCLHLDTSLLEQQNAKKLYETKKEQRGYTVGANSGWKIWKHQNKTKQNKKTPYCHFWRARSRSRVLSKPSALSTSRGASKWTKPLLTRPLDIFLLSFRVRNKLTLSQ